LVAKSAAPIASAKAPFGLGAAWRIEVLDLGEAAFSRVLFEQHHGLLAQLRADPDLGNAAFRGKTSLPPGFSE
jgi:hypothetical protein